jgi:ribose transport system permease protein
MTVRVGEPTRNGLSTRGSVLNAVRVVGGRLPVFQVALLLGLFVFGWQTIPGYSSGFSIRAMLMLGSLLGLAAAGQTLVILLGGIDISIPFVIGAVDVMTAQLTGGKGWPFPAVAAFVAAVALVIGAANGYLSHRFEVHPLIITLGTGSMLGGAVLAWTKGTLTGGAPSYLADFISPAKHTGPIPLPPVVVFWLALSLVIVLVLARTSVGRRLYATGANPRAARLTLVSTTRVWTGTFAASALLSALTGVLLAGFSGTGQFDIGDPYLFTTIASVVIGGTSLLGARGDYVRTMLGALILTQATTIMIGKGLNDPTQQVILGGAIIFFVATYGREPHVRTRV